MAAFNKFNVFVENVAEGVHNLATNQLVVALSNTSPAVANTILTDIASPVTANLTTRNVVTSTSAQSPAGTYKLVCADLVITAGPAAAAPFRYVVLYNDTPANDPLIGWYDYGTSITLGIGETFTIDFDQTNGVLTLT